MRKLWGAVGVIVGAMAQTQVQAQDTARAGGVSALTGNALAVRETVQDDLALNVQSTRTTFSRPAPRASCA